MLEVEDKVKLKASLFDKNIEEYIKEAFKNKMGDYDYKYNLFLHISPLEIMEENINSYECFIKRDWFSTFSWEEKVENVLRMAASKILQSVEDHYFSIHEVYVKCKEGLENEIFVEKSDVEWKSTHKETAKKIYLDVVDDKINLHKIMDSILFREEDFLIDERNNDRVLFNSLRLQQEEKQNLDYKNLIELDWKQLVLKEKVTIKELANLYEVKENEITKQKKLFVKSQKEFYDEYIFYEVMFHQMIISDYYSNFSIPLLIQMKAKNIQVVYEYANSSYHELFRVDEELERQKEIEKNNLAGKEYVVPLSGILLKKFYLSLKNNQLDRKLLKSDYFTTYYHKSFFSTRLKQIEESQILEQYETGEIYKNPCFKTYQELCTMMHLEVENNLDSSGLQLVPTKESKVHIPKKSNKKRIVVPKDYVKLADAKKKVGDTGEDLVYQYEWEQLKDYPKLQEKIEKTYLINDAAGYDIKSFDYEGNELFIEVKTSKTASENRIHFLISDTEEQWIYNHENAYIYYVYDLNSPKLRIIDQKTYLAFEKKIKQYEIDQDIVF